MCIQGHLVAHHWAVELMYGEAVQSMEPGCAGDEPTSPSGAPSREKVGWSSGIRSDNGRSQGQP